MWVGCAGLIGLGLYDFTRAFKDIRLATRIESALHHGMPRQEGESRWIVLDLPDSDKKNHGFALCQITKKNEAIYTSSKVQTISTDQSPFAFIQEARLNGQRLKERSDFDVFAAASYFSFAKAFKGVHFSKEMIHRMLLSKQRTIFIGMGIAFGAAAACKIHKYQNLTLKQPGL